MRSARKVTVSRAPSTGAPSLTRPRNASRGRKAAPSGRIRCSDPHASQLTSSPVVTTRPVGVQGGWFTGTRTSRASAATVATRSRSAWASTGVASRRGSAFGAHLPRTARARRLGLLSLSRPRASVFFCPWRRQLVRPPAVGMRGGARRALGLGPGMPGTICTPGSARPTPDGSSCTAGISLARPWSRPSLHATTVSARGASLLPWASSWALLVSASSSRSPWPSC